MFGDSRGQAVNTSAIVMNGPRLTPSSDRRPVYAYCDSQFSAFSTEVLNHVSWKHNRNGSPFARLAEQNET